MTEAELYKELGALTKEKDRWEESIPYSKVGIIGCGAVGGDIAIQLAMAGVETFIIMDYDVVEESDCSRHLYYDKNDIGRMKVEALSDKLKGINSSIKTYISYNAFTPETKGGASGDHRALGSECADAGGE